MVDVDEVPYGALYSFQPDYMGYLIHDEIYHEENDHEDDAKVLLFNHVIIRRVKELFTKF
jgi:hypothetical protein